MPGASRAPTASYAKVESIRVSHRRHAGSDPAFPARWCYGLFRALPGDRPFVTVASAIAEAIVAGLTPASGRQDHTTSPSENSRARLPRETSAIASRAQRP